MRPPRSASSGFTLLEALISLVVLSVVVVVGLETVGLAAAARARATDYVLLREVAEERHAVIASASGDEIRAMSGSTAGSLTTDGAEINWRQRVTEEPGSGLFRIDLEVDYAGARLSVTTYVNRFGELWRQELEEGE